MEATTRDLFADDLFGEPKRPLIEETPGLLIGTSSFSAKGWETSFYPAGTRQTDYLTFYSSRFQTVEIDSSFYGAPTAKTVEGWYRKTQPDFVISLKVPQVVTHDKILDACEPEMDEFLQNVSLLREKLGPLVLQFGYFKPSVFKTPEAFMQRLHVFLGNYPDFKFAVEVRNRNFLTREFAEMLREHKAALVLQDHSQMPLPGQLDFDFITADFTYVRLLGDRKGIEEQTKVWDRQIVDRSKELRSWVDVCQKTVRRGVKCLRQ